MWQQKLHISPDLDLRNRALSLLCPQLLHKTSICLSVITWCYDTRRELIASPLPRNSTEPSLTFNPSLTSHVVLNYVKVGGNTTDSSERGRSTLRSLFLPPSGVKIWLKLENYLINWSDGGGMEWWFALLMKGCTKTKPLLQIDRACSPGTTLEIESIREYKMN